MRSLPTILVFLATVIPALHAQPLSSPGDRWIEFRGGAQGVTAAKNLPTRWSADAGVAWNRTLPGTGQSSPVVHGGRVFVTSVEGAMKDRNHVSCFRLSDGGLLWSRSFASSVEQKLSNMVSKAAPTPAVDDRRIYAFFESGDLIALDHDGDVLWERCLTKDYGAIEGNHGIGSSVVLSAAGLHILVDHAGPSYLVAIDKKTGANLWRAERTARVSWSTPIVAKHGGVELVLVSSNGTLDAYVAATGKVAWSVDGIKGNTVPSPSLVTDDLVLVTASKGAGAVLVSLPQAGTSRQPAIRWTATPAKPSGFSSPIVVNELVLILNKAGSLSAHRLSDGTFLWRQRLAEGSWASPIIAGDLIYFFGKQGATTLLRVSPQGARIVATNRLETEATVYGVAAVDGAFVVREDARLICLRTPVEEPAEKAVGATDK